MFLMGFGFTSIPKDNFARTTILSRARQQPHAWSAMQVGCPQCQPWPINLMDRHWKGGVGVMADDVAAGLARGGVLILVQYLGTLWA